MTWLPQLGTGDGPRYLQIVSALESDVASGRVVAGQRLPTHREMATRLGLSVGTVSRAYAIAERKGLISGEVGRGTFVVGPASLLARGEDGAIQTRANLALNTPPPTGEDAALTAVLAEILADGSLPDLMGYLPHQGLERHRLSMARWVAGLGLRAAPDQLHITHGAQHAISLALRLLVRPGAPVLTETLPYSGILSLAALEGYDLRGVPMDRHGLLPDRLDDAFAASGASLLYCTPTLQAATGALMPPERRAEVAEVVARHGAWIVEDDAYGFLPPVPVLPLSAAAPDRSVYIVSFAKCLAPGLRVGLMVAPEPMRDRLVNAIRATGWMANPIMAEAAARLIDSGEMARQAAAKRAAAADRMNVARLRLGERIEAMSDIAGFHVWLRLPPGRTAAGLMTEAAQAGITIAAPTPLQPLDPMAQGLRLCLGGAPTLASLDDALARLADILASSEAMSLV